MNGINGMNGMNGSGGDSAKIITDKFSEKFLEAYRNLSAKGKSGLLRYSPVIFKRWYYSALINETTLSPSFIYGVCTENISGISAPAIRPVVAGNRLKGFTFKENKYSLRAHPFISDLHVLMEFCVPDVELDGEDKIVSPLAERISGLLSLGDPYYLEYLTKIAFLLGLLKKSGAIYSNKAVISNNYTLFKELYQEESLKKIVKASIKLCSMKINQALPSPLAFVSERGIEALIKKPVSIDDIYKKIFNSFGVDIERLWDSYNTGGSSAGEHETVLSSTFFLGVILDKWFITPFGEYLKLIEPVYCFCYKFDDELRYLSEVIKAGGNVDTALFSPCAFYSFTPFGKLFFSRDANEPVKNAPDLPIKTLLSFLDAKPDTAAHDTARALGGNAKTAEKVCRVYSFKAIQKEDKRLWCIVEVADCNTLHELHIELSLNFGLEFDGYKIYTDETANPFCEFVSPSIRGRQRKADASRLSEFDFAEGKKMAYISGGGKQFELLLLKVENVDNSENNEKKLSNNRIYPRTEKISKRLKENLSC